MDNDAKKGLILFAIVAIFMTSLLFKDSSLNSEKHTKEYILKETEIGRSARLAHEKRSAIPLIVIEYIEKKGNALGYDYLCADYIYNDSAIQSYEANTADIKGWIEQQTVNNMVSNRSVMFQNMHKRKTGNERFEFCELGWSEFGAEGSQLSGFLKRL